MAGKRREMDEEAPDLNLAPFMNLVVILIPMLLLSVVFLKIGVINITSPDLSTGPPSEEEPKDEEEDEPLDLTIAISDKGIQVSATGANLPAEDGCPEDGPTFCLTDDSVEVDELFEKAREASQSGDEEAAQEHLEEAMAVYDFRRLYNKLTEIKEKHSDERVANLSADSDVPYAVLVRTMDVVRYRLKEDEYDSDSDFWDADYEEGSDDKPYAELFPDPVLAVVK